MDAVWNYDESAGENIREYMKLCLAWIGAYVEPGILLELEAALVTSEFLDYMNSDKGVELTEEEIPQYFEENVRIHGGGGLSFTDDIVDALHHTAQAILDEQSGYWLVPTAPVSNLNPKVFSTSDGYQAFKKSIVNLGCVYFNDTISSRNSYVVLINSYDYLASYPDLIWDDTKSYSYSLVHKINEDWTISEYLDMIYVDDGKFFPRDNAYVLEDDNYTLKQINTSDRMYLRDDSLGRRLISSDGRYLRVWKSIDDYKLWSVGKQPYYVTNEWVNYDYSQDNSVTLTNTYITNTTNGGVVNNYYTTVQEAVDDANTGGTITEEQVREIVKTTISQINTDNNGSSSSGSDDDSSGSGISAIIDGIGSFFDTILTLIGKLIGMLSNFVNSVLGLFDSLTVFTDGFSSFLAGAFGFLPKEAISVIISGITLIVILAIIKFLK